MQHIFVTTSNWWATQGIFTDFKWIVEMKNLDSTLQGLEILSVSSNQGHMNDQPWIRHKPWALVTSNLVEETNDFNIIRWGTPTEWGTVCYGSANVAHAAVQKDVPCEKNLRHVLRYYLDVQVKEYIQAKETKWGIKEHEMSSKWKTFQCHKDS